MRTVPLSVQQKALLLFMRSAPDSFAYHVGYLARVVGPLSLKELTQALYQLTARHEALRSRLESDNELVVDDEPKIELSLRELSPGDDEEAIVGEQYARPFSFDAPPIRYLLLRRTSEEYLLLITAHHLIFDGTSLMLLLKELKEQYESLLARRRPRKRETKYSDFVRWQTDYLLSQEGEQGREFWRRRLLSIPHTLSLPIDHPRPSLLSYTGRSDRREAPGELVHKARHYCKERGVTLSSLILSLFAILLHRYSGQRSFIMGCAASGRVREEDLATIGYFANLLPIPVTFEPETTFGSHLSNLYTTLLICSEHRAYPFPKIVEAINPVRDLSYAPLVQVAFAYQKIENLTLSLGRAEVSPLPFAQQEGQFDLELEVLEDKASIETILKSSHALWGATTIERMHDHLHTLLSNVVSDSRYDDSSISDIPLLTKRERDEVLLLGRRVNHEPPSTKTLPELFEESVERYPGRIAVKDEQRELTYFELNRLSNSLAHTLLTNGVREGDRVGLCVGRDASIVIGILAILKAGAAYVPLDPDHPLERLQSTIEDASLSLIIGDSHAHLLATDAIPFISINEDRWREASDAAISRCHDANAIAYIIYTSGSTGRPKGVKVSHRNVTRLFTQTHQWYRFHEGDVWTLFHSHAFDFSVWEIWGALLYGGKVVVVPSCVARMPSAFLKLLEEERVTVLNQTPSAFVQLTKADEEAPGKLHLRWVIFGGEALELGSLKGWFDRRGDAVPKLVNMYGITETTVHVTYRPLSVQDLAHRRSVIGNPIPDLSLYILDEALAPVPIGIPGEIYVSGEGVSQGYHQREELTEGRFIPNPFGEGRLYRTGDLARWLPNGDIEYLGRRDHQVKIRGFRVELGEIEHKLLELDEVSAVHVLLRQEEKEHELIAFVIAHDATEEGLREELKRSLPSYMIPSRILLIDAFPLTTNGKLDREKLLELRASSKVEGNVEPLNYHEKALHRIWSTLLNRSDIKKSDRFFDIGGHSFLAPTLLVEIEKEFGVKLPLSTLFQQQSLSDMSSIVVSMQREERSPLFSISIPLSHRPNRPLLFCVAGGGGSALYYRELAEALEGFTVIGLQAQGVDGLEEPLIEIEEIVERYVKEIRTLQPGGPYHLAGHCVGGLLAHAVAQRMKREGAIINLVAVIDAPAPINLSISGLMTWDDSEWFEKIARLMGESFGCHIDLPRESLLHLTEQQRLSLLHESLERHNLYPPKTSRKPLEGMVKLFKAHSRLSFHHPQTIKLPLFLIRPTDRHPDYDFSEQEVLYGSHLGWEKFGDPFMGVRRVPGFHLSMLTQGNQRVVAQMLELALAGSLNLKVEGE